MFALAYLFLKVQSLEIIKVEVLADSHYKYTIKNCTLGVKKKISFLREETISGKRQTIVPLNDSSCCDISSVVWLKIV